MTEKRTTALMTAKLLLLFAMMPACIVMAFLWAPAAEILGESSRLLYFHVPLAWVSALAFIVAGIASAVHLSDGSGRYPALPELAYGSTEIGLLFTALATVAGAVWSKLSWGAYWNWDPRQTSIVALLLIYIAYVSLYSALHGNPNRSRIVSAYLVLATVTVPFFMFVVPRVFPSLHPNPIINPERRILLETSMKITLGLSIIAHTLLYAYLLDLKRRLAALREKTERD